jgi:hypothetical protein
MISERKTSGLFSLRHRGSDELLNVNEEVEVKARCLRVTLEDETHSLLCDIDITSQGQTHQAKVPYHTLKEIQVEQKEKNAATPEIPGIEDELPESEELEMK